MLNITTAPAHIINSQLGKVEFTLGRTFLEARPGYITIVLGNGCNINCLHCYQEKNGDNLLRNREIGYALRQEFREFYPYLETLRIQGGEVFVLRGFVDLVNDVANAVDRPIISISTNGTLLDESWCRRIVEMPFQTVTFSFDAGVKQTFEKLRRGADYDVVVNNIKRLQDYKLARDSWYPNIDAFFVVMRSNFRELMQFMDLMMELGIYEVTFQTLLVDDRNLQREPGLINEQITDPGEIRELHQLLENLLGKYRRKFDVISFSGLKSLFENAGLVSDFLDEEGQSLLPALDRRRKQRIDVNPPPPAQYEMPKISDGTIREQLENGQCPNPWTTLFVTENGDISLCFLSEPVGNLYSASLVEIWNSPTAVDKRVRMLSGQYAASGCSTLWCDWRDGRVHKMQPQNEWHGLIGKFKLLAQQLLAHEKTPHEPIDRNLKALRRLVRNKDDRIQELESSLSQLWKDNAELHQRGQIYILELEENNMKMNANYSRSHKAYQKYIRYLENRVQDLQQQLEISSQPDKNRSADLERTLNR